MNWAVLVVLMTTSAIMYGQKAQVGSSNLAAVSVLVQSSRLVTTCESEGPAVKCGFAQELRVLVNRKELTVVEDGFDKALLKLGTYQGKIEQQGKGYEFERSIELQFPDGKTRRYLMVDGNQ